MRRATSCRGHPDRRRRAAQQSSHLPNSAKLSSRWFEFDLGWAYICGLRVLGLAHRAQGRAAASGSIARSCTPTSRRCSLITHRYAAATRYARSLQQAFCPAKLASPARAGGARGDARRADIPSRGGSRRWFQSDVPQAPRNASARRLAAGAGTQQGVAYAPRACARTWPRCGSARTNRASSSWHACRTGATGRKRRAFRRWRSSRCSSKRYA